MSEFPGNIENEMLVYKEYASSFNLAVSICTCLITYLGCWRQNSQLLCTSTLLLYNLSRVGRMLDTARHIKLLVLPSGPKSFSTICFPPQLALECSVISLWFSRRATWQADLMVNSCFISDFLSISMYLYFGLGLAELPEFHHRFLGQKFQQSLFYPTARYAL